ncbi:class I SAM-dependent methyltransferase [Halalkalicoccus salilacus]|uniref:class I SAM-dependent methyltransferase n=1 Tax=Halalkalicoccus TaxID=332246 RepID=UPI002F96407E
MDIPRTVTAALEEQPVAGATCLEAGAGGGNMTSGLLAAGATHVYSVTNRDDHAKSVTERVGTAARDRIAVLKADLRTLPIESNSIEVIAAHGLFNVLVPASLPVVIEELTRVAAADCLLILDDYEPLPSDASIRELFAIENALTELADGHAALTFYPAVVLQALFAEYGWKFDHKHLLLDPVPWTENHISAHARAARTAAMKLSDPLKKILLTEIKRIVEAVDDEATGKMYSMTLSFSHNENDNKHSC